MKIPLRGLAIGLALLAASCASPPQTTTVIAWPPNDGCALPESTTFLTPGLLIDRYGSNAGYFFSIPGTPYAERSMPYAKPPSPYHIYQVMKPTPAIECKVAPWFGEPGGGEQFKTTEDVSKLKDEGFIQKVQ